MPLKLNVGLNRKVGDPNCSSRGASVNVELELDSTLVNDPPKLREKIRQLYSLVRTSLTEELNGNGNGNGHAANGNGQMTNGDTPRPRPATQSQVKALYAIAKSKRLNISDFVQNRFHVHQPEELSLKEASSLIDELKRNGQGGD